MKQLRILSLVLVLTLSVLPVLAQDRPRELPEELHELMNQPYVSPDTVAKRQTNELSVELGLTEKQYKKVYKLLLKQEKQRRENMYAHLVPQGEGASSGMNNGPRSGGGPGVPGMGTPPGGIGGGQPPMNGKGPMGPPPTSAPTQDIAKKQKKEHEKFQKNMKKVLTDTQYDKWLTISSQRPPMPGKPNNNKRQ